MRDLFILWLCRRTSHVDEIYISTHHFQKAVQARDVTYHGRITVSCRYSPSLVPIHRRPEWLCVGLLIENSCTFTATCYSGSLYSNSCRVAIVSSITSCVQGPSPYCVCLQLISCFVFCLVNMKAVFQNADLPLIWITCILLFCDLCRSAFTYKNLSTDVSCLHWEASMVSYFRILVQWNDCDCLYDNCTGSESLTS